MITYPTLFAAAFAPVFAFCPPKPPTVGGDSTCASCWRSRLYPESWTPASTDAGRFLHDFSYAGYRWGEVEPARVVPGGTWSVLAHGADATGQSDSTTAIQAAIDAAAGAGGGAVLLPGGTYRCDGLIRVGASGVVLRGDGPSATRLVFTRSADMTDVSHITFAGAARTGPQVPLARDGVSRSHFVYVQDSTGLEPGADVQVGWTITDAFIDRFEMAGTWVSFNGQWKTFFQRTIVSVDRTVSPHAIELDVPLRYDAKMSDGASLRVVSGYLAEVGIEDLSISNAVDWDDAHDVDRVHAIGLTRVKDGWVRNVRSFDSPWSDDNRDAHLMSGGIIVSDSKRVTVSDCTMEEAQNRGPNGNGYLFEIMRSSEVLVRDSIGRKGRHNFIQNWDFGTSGCVFLRTHSEDGRAFQGTWDPIGVEACSEFHHSLAMANLIDDSEVDDCWAAENRNDYSSGAGLTATESVFWRTRGKGKVRSYQAGLGYVIGSIDVTVKTGLNVIDPISNPAKHTAPEDYTEGLGHGANLRPLSLYQDQLAKRLGP